MLKLLFSLSINAALLSSGFSEKVDGHIRSCWCCFETRHAYHFSTVVLVKCWFLPHVLRNAGKLQRIHQTPCLSRALMNGLETAWSGFLKGGRRRRLSENWSELKKQGKGKSFPPCFKTNVSFAPHFLSILCALIHYHCERSLVFSHLSVMADTLYWQYGGCIN